MVASDWVAEAKEKKGKFLRFFFSNPATAPARAAGVLETLPIYDEDLGHYNDNQHPGPTEIKKFRNMIITNFSSALDGLLVNFLPSITNAEISDLYGDDVGGDDILKSSATTSTIKIRSLGMTSGSEAQETGIAHQQYIRGLEQKVITTPDVYVADANKELQDIDDKTLTVYNTSLKKYYNDYKYPLEKSKEMALHDKDVYKRILLDQYNRIYKRDMFEEASKKIYKSK